MSSSQQLDTTEKLKMLAGENYNPMDPLLLEERLNARRFVRKFNQEEDSNNQREILKQLFGKFTETSFIEPDFRCDYGYNISVGEYFFANFGCVMLDICAIKIGDNVMLGPNVQLYTAGHSVDPVERASGVEFGKPITIGDRCWIGGGAIILPGVTIGENTTIGAGSVVTRDIPANVVAVGNPARVIKHLSSQ
jgi:maltose O-acetyltransferase